MRNQCFIELHDKYDLSYKRMINVSAIETVEDHIVHLHDRHYYVAETYGEIKQLIEMANESLKAGPVQKQEQPAALSFDNMPKHSHSFKTNWKPDPNDYLADKGAVSSNTVKDPANNNS